MTLSNIIQPQINAAPKSKKKNKYINKIIAKSLKYDQYIIIMMQKITLVNMSNGFGL